MIFHAFPTHIPAGLARRVSIVSVLTANCLFLSGILAAELVKQETTSVDTAVPGETNSLPDTGLDPTILNSRVALTNEFKNQDMGAIKNTTTLNLAYAFGNPVRHDWTVQLDLPVVYYDAGQRTGVEGGTGPGDIECRIGHVLHSEGILRYAVGLEAEFDTASGPPRGDGLFRLSPAIAFAVEPCKWFKFQTFLQFNQSLITESDVSEEQEIDFKPSITFNLPSSWYLYTEFEEEWELPADGDFTSTFKFEVGRGFGAHQEWALSARCELPLTKSSDDYTLTFGCTYTFK